MNGIKIKNLVFDLDGTLIDTAQDIIDTIVSSFYKNGFILSEENKKKLRIGPPVKKMIENIDPDLSIEMREKILSGFRTGYDTSDYPFSRIYPGVEEILRIVHNKKKIFVATNKPFIPTERLLVKFGLRGFFQDVFTASGGVKSYDSKDDIIQDLLDKWQIEGEETVVIGDTAADIRSARNKGCISAAFYGGYGDREELNSENPDYRLDKMRQLLTLLNLEV